MNGWIKLHRKLLENPLWQHDRNAIHVFMTLLLLVDKQKATWSGGRFQLAAVSGLKPTTMYQALRRLEKAKMVTLSSNNKYSTITICKWKDYQSVGDRSDDNKMTTGRQQDDTLTRIENKRIKKKDTNVSFGDPDVNEVLSFWAETTNLPINSKVPLNRANARTLLNRHTLDEVKRLIQGAAVANLEEYSGIRISNIVELQMNESKLILWGQKRNQENLTQGVVKI